MTTLALEFGLQIDWAALFNPHHDWRRKRFDEQWHLIKGIVPVTLRAIVRPDDLAGDGIAKPLAEAIKPARFVNGLCRRFEERPEVEAARKAFWTACPDYLAGQLWRNLIVCVVTEVDDYLACWQRGNHPLGFDAAGRLILVCAPPSP